MENIDVLVIGAGPSGAIASSIIKQAGYSVKMVEKLKFPRFVIGESLLPNCMTALEAAGLLDAVKAKGFQEKFGAKFVRGNEVCDFNFSEQYTEGWSWTWQVPRAEFDYTLATTAQSKGVDLHFETEVLGIKFFDDYSITTTKDKEGNENKIKAKFIVDASGYGRVIPRLFNLDRPSHLPARKTFFAHLKDNYRNDYDEPNRIIIIVHRPEIWVWVIPFSNGNTSVGFVGDKSFFDELKGDTDEEKYRNMIASEPHIAKRFENAAIILPPQTIEGWSVTTDQFYGKGFVLTGNVTEFLDPVFSSGVTLAAMSSKKAAELVVKQLQGNTVDWQKEYQDYVTYGVNAFRTYVNGWYDGSLHTVFFSKQQDEKIRQKICSVLAGHVWDETNEYVAESDKNLHNLTRIIRAQEKLMAQ